MFAMAKCRPANCRYETEIEAKIDNSEGYQDSGESERGEKVYDHPHNDEDFKGNMTVHRCFQFPLIDLAIRDSNRKIICQFRAGTL